ncbi:DDE-type integrase/transposase/recombinase [Streptomyces sp. NPDC008222]|uniref:DDE-type integrase/transposase/recombinase n=1 Tax=Streptomyces sp. NPDC008222 TaxID=3364820 RepID=UPI0036E31C0A
MAGTVFEDARARALEDLAGVVGRVKACAALGVSRATYYRHHRKSPPPVRLPRREPRRQLRALAPAEEARVLEVLRSQEFVHMAPGEIYAVLLDRGSHLCSESTMYRLLRRHGEVRERRRQATQPPCKKPKLVAEDQNRAWSWDITKLKGPVKGSYYCLYTIIDIYSRYTVGWMLATSENKNWPSSSCPPRSPSTRWSTDRFRAVHGRLRNNEGRITDLKLQKRIMAGRAGVPLLRHRVILMALLRRRYP